MLAPLHSPLEDTTKVRGGWRTRDAVEVAAAASRSPRRTVGVNRMLLSWAKGHNSTHELWWQSDGHVQDGSTVPGLVRLSRLGALNSDKACFANMIKLLRICNIPQLIREVVPSGAVTHCLPPTQLFALIFRQNKVLFTRSFAARRDHLRSFWTAYFGSVDGQQYRDLHRFLRNKFPEHLDTCTPFVFHQDTGPFTKHKGTDMICWGPLLGEGPDLATRFIYCAQVAVKGSDPYTAAAAWQMFYDEMDLLATCRQADGTPLAEDVDGTKWGGCVAPFSVGLRDASTVGASQPWYERGCVHRLRMQSYGSPLHRCQGGCSLAGPPCEDQSSVLGSML